MADERVLIFLTACVFFILLPPQLFFRTLFEAKIVRHVLRPHTRDWIGEISERGESRIKGDKFAAQTVNISDIDL